MTATAQQTSTSSHAATSSATEGNTATGSRLIFVKWATPAEEALSTVRLAHALVDRHIAVPSDIAIVVPGRIWAANFTRAAQSLGIATSLCIAQSETPATRKAFQRLSDAANLNLRGRSLAHRAQLDTVAELAHGLQAIEGEETTAQLEALLRAQMATPSVAPHTSCIPIMLASDMRSTPSYVFLTGCVDGLYPTAPTAPTTSTASTIRTPTVNTAPPATGTTPPAADAVQNSCDVSAATPANAKGGHKDSVDMQRQMFWNVAHASTVRTTLSSFVKAPEALAHQLGLAVARYKTEGEQRMAMLRPSPFLTETGQARPSTTGGQALLRTYGLN